MKCSAFGFLWVGLAPTSALLAQPLLINPSFEVDPMPAGAGYAAITGWTSDRAIGDGYGINWKNGPFADNGFIPDGARVAFMQDNGTLSQTVSGFTPGATYWLGFHENARGLCCGEREATLKVLINGLTVVAEHVVPVVGADNPYLFVLSQPFAAPDIDLTISIVKGGFGDSTALIDGLQIFDSNIKLSINMWGDFVPEIQIHGRAGRNVILEMTHELSKTPIWSPVGEATLSDRPTLLLDPAALGDAPRFYRAKEKP